MTDDEPGALEHENWIAYLTGVVSCTRGAQVVRGGGAVTILTGLPFDWFNQVLIQREDATQAGVLAGVAPARERGHHFVVRLRGGIDDRFTPTLTQAGLEPAGGTLLPGMVALPIDRDAIASHVAPEFEIRRVTDTAGMVAHNRTVTAGFGSDPAVALGTARRDLLDRPECAVYVGYTDGDPVVSGLGWRTGRTVGSTASRRSIRRADAGTGRR